MKPIVTLTLNPAIDSSCQADAVGPVHKIRTFDERYDPGGGGVNVARVIRELGGEAVAVYLAGGLTGQAFTRMVDAIGLQHRAIPIRGYTRVSHTVYERSSGQEYRFVPQGPEIHEDEWQTCLRELESLEFDYLVASGSLPEGVPDDFYASVARMVSGRGARFVLDTSGAALRRALEAGVYLVKPNLRELESVVARSLREPAEQEEGARQLVARGHAEIVTVSLGARWCAARNACGLPAPARAQGQAEERGRRGRQFRRRHDIRPSPRAHAGGCLRARRGDGDRDRADHGHRALPARGRPAHLSPDQGGAGHPGSSHRRVRKAAARELGRAMRGSAPCWPTSTPRR